MKKNLKQKAISLLLILCMLAAALPSFAEEAAADYTECISHGYEPAQSYYQRAQVYSAMGETEKQNADLTESLKYTE